MSLSLKVLSNNVISLLCCCHQILRYHNFTSGHITFLNSKDFELGIHIGMPKKEFYYVNLSI